MNVQIDTTTGTCSVVIDGTTHHSALGDVRISTDPQARMSVLHIDGTSVHVPEDEAEHLIAAGAVDDRTNLIADE
ncbi:hypothetical protein BAY1663_05004 [Pseudomonas sp. BAY1663]|uniref:DUF3203 family protein n=1 Tax=Pseudomonas sp. BAY1663 TaxID=1439940 RepID=UPI00042DF6CE|nr:DUF3203 family protein [Pseudomonas sp. BAY1663]EXF42589.1 hypothetical protein BAY1663_05004 [Pseudomonas sp. BAY1663]